MLPPLIAVANLMAQSITQVDGVGVVYEFFLAFFFVAGSLVQRNVESAFQTMFAGVELLTYRNFLLWGFSAVDKEREVTPCLMAEIADVH